MPGWKWISIIVLSTALLVGCGTAASPPTAAPISSPTVQLSPIVVPQDSPTAPQSPLPTRGDQVSSDPILARLVEQARADLAQRLGLSAESFQLRRADVVEWPDTSLGCPQPGFMYAQVVTPGYLIVLVANEREYEYHSDNRRVALCVK